jgi:tetratricopeptide (TPR) repeat protein
MKRAIALTILFWTAAAGTAWPIDQIFTSTSEKAHFGQIVSVSSAGINMKLQRTEVPMEIPANEITRVVFENSPDGLLSAQKAILDGEYEKALEALKKESTEDKRPEVADEIIFCRAYCTAQMALAGGADTLDAAKQLVSFIKGSPNSFHYLKACEVMGDICVSAGKFSAAQEYYGKLSQAPWPDYKIRAQVALGRAFLAQNKAAEAEKAFDEALNNDAPGELSEMQRTSARIGKARCMILAGKTEPALRSLTEILDKMDEKNEEVCAMAYNALGTAYRKDGKPALAIRAFLKVHLMYNTLPDAHAEAVANLEQLFTETHKPVHAREMREILGDRYKNSRWAKLGGK